MYKRQVVEVFPFVLRQGGQNINEPPVGLPLCGNAFQNALFIDLGCPRRDILRVDHRGRRHQHEVHPARVALGKALDGGKVLRHPLFLIFQDAVMPVSYTHLAAWVLEVSHMGYLFGLFDALGVPENARPDLLEKLREKNAHELRRAAQAAGLDAAGAAALTGLLELSGSCEETLAKAESCLLYTSFENTAAFRWLCQHAGEYGFILRYPKGAEEKTEITYEPWHWRYVGVENAAKINASGLCFEDYIATLQQIAG